MFYQLFVVCFLASVAPPLVGTDGIKGIFGFCRTRVGCGPASCPTLKKALCCTCPVVGRRINKVQEEIPSEEVSTLQIGSVAFPAAQYTSPQLHPCH